MSSWYEDHLIVWRYLDSPLGLALVLVPAAATRRLCVWRGVCVCVGGGGGVRGGGGERGGGR